MAKKKVAKKPVKRASKPTIENTLEKIVGVLDHLSSRIDNIEKNKTIQTKPLKTKNTKEVAPIDAPQTVNKFDEMPERHLHKADVAADKKYWKNRQITERREEVKPSIVACSKCHTQKEVFNISDYIDTASYICNDCLAGLKKL